MIEPKLNSQNAQNTFAQSLIALCQRASSERISGYDDALASVPPSLYGEQIYHSQGIDITNGGHTQTIASNSLVLPLVDNYLIPQSVAIIPPLDERECKRPYEFEPYANGAFILGQWTGQNPVYLMTDLEASLRLAIAKPDSVVLVCFTQNNLINIAKQWQFIAKNGLFIPITILELAEYQTLLTAVNAVIIEMDYHIDFIQSNEETSDLLADGKYIRLNDVDSLASLTNEEKQALSWQEINDKEPFSLLIDEHGEPNTYPINALPPIARGAVQAIAHHSQAPLSMAGQCVLGVLSCLAQPHVNAYDKNSRHGQPCSLFVLTEGASGDRKSTCQKLANQRIFERQKLKIARYKEDLQNHRITLASCKSAKERADILENHPEPTNPQTLFKDATLEPIISAFIRGDITHGAWATSEAGQIFGGHSLQSDNKTSVLSALTQLWDDGTCERPAPALTKTKAE